jgi:Phage integrase family
MGAPRRTVPTQRGALPADGARDRVRIRGAMAGIDALHPHRFRHTFAHDFLMSGGQGRDLKRLAGWTSDVMLERYGASAADARAKAGGAAAETRRPGMNPEPLRSVAEAIARGTKRATLRLLEVACPHDDKRLVEVFRTDDGPYVLWQSATRYRIEHGQLVLATNLTPWTIDRTRLEWWDNPFASQPVPDQLIPDVIRRRQLLLDNSGIGEFEEVDALRTPGSVLRP